MALGKIIREFGVKLSLVFDEKKIEKANKSMEEMGRGLKEIGLHVAEASAALFELANISGEHSRHLEENSEQLGINVERLQELGYAAKVAAGISQEELVGSLESVSKTLDEARRGSLESAQSLIRLGVPLSLITDRSKRADQVMLVLADRFKNIQDPIAKSALAQQVFGASGAKLLPLLNKGSQGIAAMGKEARSLGVIMDEGMIKEGAEFDRTLSRIWIVLKNITFVIGAELIKYLGPLVEQFQKFIVQNRKFLALGIAAVMKNLGKFLEIVFKTVRFLAERFKFLVSVMGGLERVTKLLAIAFGIFTAARLVGMVGTLVKSFQALATVFGVLDIEALAIGAALLALILVVQDLFSDDSIIKEWIGTFQEEFPNAFKLLQGIFDVVKASIMDTIAAFETLFGWIMKGIEAIEDFGGYLNKAFGLADKFSSAFKGISDFVGPKIGAVGDYLSASANHATPSSGAGNSATSNNTKMQANITVQVPPGTSAKDATGIVSDGVQDGFDSMLRQTRNQAIGGVAY